MKNYKIDEAKFLSDYFAIEESRDSKIKESESVLAELGDRIKRLKPETVAQIRADIVADIDREIGEQKYFYDKYIIIEDICECVDNCVAVGEQYFETVQIVEPTIYEAIQTNTEAIEPSPTVDIDFSFEAPIIDTNMNIGTEDLIKNL